MPLVFHPLAPDFVASVRTGGPDANGQPAEHAISDGDGVPCRSCLCDVPKGAQIVLSPWHLHRHERLWENPDGFDPGRWQTENGKQCGRDAFIPFSAGPRVCTGAGFAMLEGPLMLSMILRELRVSPVEGRTPMPEAHLTVRSRDGIWLRIDARDRV